jgi:dihydroorotate dehydrogenase (fumarate)
VMTTSALLRHGVGHMATMLSDLQSWLAARQFGSLDDMRGIMDQQSLRDPQAFERANYIKILQGYRR